MRTVRRRFDLGWALVTALIVAPASASPGTEPPTFPVEPAQLAKAEAMHVLPCLGGSVDQASPFEGYTNEPGLEPVWHVAQTMIAVRRAGADRFAFVLKPPRTGEDTCTVQQVIVLPRRGMMMQCGLPDASSKGIGVHVQSASGQRDTVFWEAGPKGLLHRLPLDAAGIEADTGDLICSLPE